MNTIPVAVFLIILLFVQEHFCNVGDEIKDFFESIPGGVKDAAQKTGNAFESAWNAIKKPFTIRRMGRGGRRKRRKTTTSTTSTEAFSTVPEIVQMFRKVPIPLLPTPQWRGMDHWNMQQLPRYALTEGIDYEFRRSQISKWADKYIGPRPTRMTRSSTMPPAPPTNTYEADEPVRTAWHVVANTAYIKDDQIYRPIDYYVLALN